MASSQDTEITLGTAKLLGLFFGLVMVCAVFFALGYTLGRKADVGLAATSAAVPLPATGNSSKPVNSAASQTPMTFYKAVEQQSANPPQLTPASADAGSTGGNGSQTSASPASASPGASGSGSSSSGNQAGQNGNAPDPVVTIPGPGYFVQVAAVSKQDDADALVDALKKKEYPAFVASGATDKLFRVQVGPFNDIKDAEAMRSRLVNDGYNPILKK